jgi:signal transduction histidine kinase
MTFFGHIFSINLIPLIQGNETNEAVGGILNMELFVFLVLALAVLVSVAWIFSMRAYKKLNKKFGQLNDEQKRILILNDELEFKNESLEELNLEKNNMISVVAHDFKAPLGNIEGLIELIKLNKETLTKEQVDYIEMLKKVTQETASMVDVMLNVHRIESELHELTLHKYDILEILRKVIRLHEPTAKLKKKKIVFAPKAKVCELNTDKQYFHQIISNILENAVNFAPDNTGVIVRLIEGDTSVSISITDFGPGISKTDHKRLFSGYTKLGGEKSEGKPTGTGLAIVLRLVEKLQGKIDVKSEEGKGSTFTVSFIKRI